MKNNMSLWLSLCVFTMMACSKMDDYRKYTDEKEIVYSGKADSLVVYPGKNRVMLSWVLVSDPKISKARVYWRNKADSVEVPITRGQGVDIVKVVLENMDEGSYSFEVVTFHQDQQVRSVPAFISGRVYGERYRNTLLNRALLKTEVLANDAVKLQFAANPDTLMMRTEVEYKTKQGETKVLKVKNDVNEVTINDYLKPSSFTYRTLFIPDPVAIDTFYTEAQKVTPVFEKLLNKSLFADVTFPGDALIYVNERNIAKKNIWDGKFSVNYASPYGDYTNMTTNDTKSPLHITVDLGVTEQLKRFRLNHYYTYQNRAPRKYEIWHAESPDADGSWEDWTKRADVEQVKSTGAAIARAAWEAGDNVNISRDMPKVRYLRIKCTENWRTGDTNFAIAEITLWAYDEEVE